MKLFPKNVKIALKRVIIISTIVVFIGFILENNKILGGKFLSDFMKDHLDNHAGEKVDFWYVAYYAIIYMCLTAYAIATIYICLKRHSTAWCALVIFISIVFLVFMSAYLTITLQYDEKAVLYTVYMNCYIGLATIISGIAGIKMTFLLKDKRKITELKMLRETYIEELQKHNLQQIADIKEKINKMLANEENRKQ